MLASWLEMAAGACGTKDLHNNLELLDFLKSDPEIEARGRHRAGRLLDGADFLRLEGAD